MVDTYHFQFTWPILLSNLETLSRYAAAELYPVRRRGFAISSVIWAATIGAVGGPLLLAPSSAAVGALGSSAMTGPFLLATLASCIAVLAVGSRAMRTPNRLASPAPLRGLVRVPAARSAFAVMGCAQVVMVAVMTAAPLDMHMHGQGLGAVGTVLSAHTLGMFALSPLTGWLLDRVGPRPVMFAGLAVLAIAACLAAAAPAGNAPIRTVGLFLLGYGWNLCFVGGSVGSPATSRPRTGHASRAPSTRPCGGRPRRQVWAPRPSSRSPDTPYWRGRLAFS